MIFLSKKCERLEYIGKIYEIPLSELLKGFYYYFKEKNLNKEALRAHYIIWKEIEKLSWKEIEKEIRETYSLGMKSSPEYSGF